MHEGLAADLPAILVCPYRCLRDPFVGEALELFPSWEKSRVRRDDLPAVMVAALELFEQERSRSEGWELEASRQEARDEAEARRRLGHG